jgi:hypothetical protein
MNREDFKILLGSYGADILRWPEGLQNSAVPLFARYPELVADATAMDALLDSYTVADISPEFLETVIQVAHGAQNDNSPLGLRAVWARVSLLAACVVIGFWCGSASLGVETHYAASENSMKPLLLGPTKLSEVML